MDTWVLFAAGAAAFAGVTSILAKIGMRGTDSSLATALRTVVVLAFAWAIAFAAGSLGGLGDLNAFSALFIVLSGLATGGSWLFYFKALQDGPVNKIVPIDKSSVLLTMAFAFAFFNEPFSVFKGIGLGGIAVGTYLMVSFKGGGKLGRWLVYAVLSALCAAATSLLIKIGLRDMDANLGTALRTAVVLVMAWLVVFVTGRHKGLGEIRLKGWVFIFLSALTTGFSWLCFNHALKNGPASVVVPIDKLSVLVTVAFSAAVLKERIGIKALIGLAVLTAGTLLLLF